jgi:hypothetical protein
MGKPGEQYVDTFRRSMAPQVDTESSQSMKDYSLWARRNGYDDEAVRYENMAIERGKVEAGQEFKKANLSDTTVMRKIHGALKNEELSAEQSAALSQAYSLAEGRLNQRGANYEAGKGTEGSDMAQILVAEDAASAKLAREVTKHRIEVQKEMDRRAELKAAGTIMPEGSLTASQYEAYKRQMANAISNADRAGINERWEKAFASHAEQKQAGAAAEARMDVAIEIEALRTADKDKTLWFDGPVSEWMSENPELVRSAQDATAEALTNNPEFIEAGPEKREQIARQTFRDYLKATDSAFRNGLGDLEREAYAEQVAASARAQFADRYWDKDREPGGEAYRQALTLTIFSPDRKDAIGTPLSEEEVAHFNSVWDKTHGNPTPQDMVGKLQSDRITDASW